MLIVTRITKPGRNAGKRKREKPGSLPQRGRSAQLKDARIVFVSPLKVEDLVINRLKVGTTNLVAYV